MKMAGRAVRSVLNFLKDESGVIHVSGYLLVMTIVVLGMLAGVTSVRNQIVQSFGDLAVSLESLDQSYSYSVGASTSEFTDSTTLTDPANSEPAGITVQAAAGGGG